ncbi:hypothetical protein [Methanobacterium oryzae]|uniref:hypothetical protein n=1 Tax=Methanobacterium oryzae TaxID=69540 RepID=UPI003D24BF55
MENKKPPEQLFKNAKDKYSKFRKLSHLISVKIVLAILAILILMYLFALVTFDSNLILYKEYNVLIIAPISFLLIVIYESIKSNYIELGLINALNNEVYRNFTTAKNNTDRLLINLEYLPNNQNIFAPLVKFQLNTYNIIKQVIPHRIYENGLVLENYAGIANQANDLIKYIEEIGQNTHINDNTYISTLYERNKDILGSTTMLLNLINSYFEKKGKILELDSKEIEKLTNKENYDEFIKLNNIDKNSFSINEFQDAHNRNVMNVFILVLKH